MRLEILNAIYKLRSAYFGALTEAVDIPPADLSAILSNLIHEGYLFPVASSNGPYNLTNRGREYRLELEKAANAKAKYEAQNAEAKAERAASEKKKLSHDFQVAIISSLITAVFSIVLQNLNVLLELLKHLLV